jgi:hypothetical protein
MERRERKGAGISREELQGRLQDPTGTDTEATAPNTGNDQQQTKGGEGKEGGAAGKFVRGFREGGGAARPRDPEDSLAERDAEEPRSQKS